MKLMKKTTLLMVFIFISCHLAIAQKTPEYLWGKSIGGADVAVDYSGFLYVASVFSDTITQGGQTFISNGSSDAILSKMDGNGKVIWQKQIGGKHNDYLAKIRCDNTGNIYIMGDYQYETIIGTDTLSGKGYRNAFFAKLDPLGNVLWSKSIGNLSDNIWNSIAIDNSGNAYVGVHAYIPSGDTLQIGSFQFKSRGTNDIFIAKLNASGDFIWAIQEGGPNRESILSIATDNAGGFYTTGYFSDSTYFGTTLLPDASESNIFLAKYDSAGILQFVTVPQKSKGVGFDLAIDKSGYIYQCGKINDTAIFGGSSLMVSTTSSFLAKYDNAGNIIWAKSYPYSSYHHAFRMSLDRNNDIYVNMVSGIASIVKYSNNGDIIWSNEYGPHIVAPSVSGLCADNQGNVYFTGTCNNKYNIFGRDTIQVKQNNPNPSFTAKAGPFPSNILKQRDNEHSLILYPNPNNGSFTVRGNNMSDNLNYDIISLTGLMVANGSLQSVGNSAEIITGGLHPGIYIVRLYTGGDITALTFRIE